MENGMANTAADPIESHEFSTADLADSARIPIVVERRRELRRSIALRARVTVMGLSVLPGHLVDLSRQGASLTLPFPLSNGQACAIDLELEACGITGDYHIAAKVRYCVPAINARYRIGVRFEELDEATAALITSLLNA
jgi:hypothetical protein